MNSSNVELWTTADVQTWLNSIGLGAYEKKFKDAEINGEILLSADEDLLKELKIKSVGHRLLLLKSVQSLRVLAGFEWTDEQGGVQFMGSGEDFTRLEDMIRERDFIIDEMLKQLNQVQSDLEMLKQHQQPETSPSLPKSPSSKPSLKNFKQSPSFNNFGNLKQISSQESFQTTAGNADLNTPEAGVIKVYGHDLRIDDSADAYKTVVVNIDDTCSRVLPMAMKKWGLKDDWKKYALFMSVNGDETCLSYDDKPWALVLKSKDSPVFILKSLRTTESVILVVNDKKKTMSRYSHIMDVSRQSRMSTFTDDNSIPNGSFSARDTSQMSKYLSNIPASVSAGSNETAVAIYEYKAGRDDELDVNIGDNFFIRDKTETGWWVVERQGKTGWVPSGCLVESSTETITAPQNGYALYDYIAVGANELSLKKDENLVILKKYQHWFMALLNGKEGWVPSCYVGLEDNNPKKSETKLDIIEETLDENGSLPRQTPQYQEYQSRASPRASVALQEFVGGINKLKKSSVYSTIPKYGTSSTLKTLVSNGRNSNSVVGGSNSHGALNKLDSLLDSFDPYLEEHNSARQSVAIPNQQNNIGHKDQKLGNLINDLAQNIADLHDEVSASQEGSLDSIESAEAMAATKELADLVKSSQQKVEKYDELADKLSDLLEQCSRMAETKPGTSDTQSTRIESINETLAKTYTTLSDVTGMLLKQSESGEDEARSLKRTSQTAYEIEDGKVNPKDSLSTPMRSRPSKNNLLTSELVQIDNQKLMAEQSTPVPTRSNTGTGQTQRRIIPYQQLIRKEVSLDVEMEHLELYLSNEECLQYLGCTYDELRDMPSWQLNQRKKRANLLI